jgi:hypothetical protein
MYAGTRCAPECRVCTDTTFSIHIHTLNSHHVAVWKGDMPMVSLKLMAGGARSMVVVSCLTAAEMAARWWGRGGDSRAPRPWSQ